MGFARLIAIQLCRVELYAPKLAKAGVDVQRRHYDEMTHGWLRMSAWSQDATHVILDSVADLRDDQW